MRKMIDLNGAIKVEKFKKAYEKAEITNLWLRIKIK